MSSDAVEKFSCRLRFTLRHDEMGMPGLFAYLARQDSEARRAYCLRTMLFAHETGTPIPADFYAAQEEGAAQDHRSVSFRFRINDCEFGFQNLTSTLKSCPNNAQRIGVIKRVLSELLGANPEAAVISTRPSSGLPPSNPRVQSQPPPDARQEKNGEISSQPAISEEIKQRFRASASALDFV